VLGVVAGSATLTGALLVGDSMRGSLRETAVGRLNGVTHAMVSQRFFRRELAHEIAADAGFPEHFARASAVILLTGSITSADSGSRADGINVLGVDDAFFQRQKSDWPEGFSEGQFGVLNNALADDLGVDPGDDVLIRVTKPAAIPSETLLGDKNDTTVTFRLPVQRIAKGYGASIFSLSPKHRVPRNAFVPISALQRFLGRRNQANALLVFGRGNDRHDDHGDPAADSQWLAEALKRHLRLIDVGLTLRVDAQRSYVSLESDRFMIEHAVERAANEAAKRTNVRSGSILTYLANKIAVGHAGAKKSIPYSTVSALDARAATICGLKLRDGTDTPAIQSGEILLNQWAADRLNASVGDQITLSYYVSSRFGQIKTREKSFVLRGVVRLEGNGDPGFAPTYPGVTDSDNMADWDPPFPVDLKTISDRDEQYWDRYRTTPKAFVSLVDGVAMWIDDSDRFGSLTSIRLVPPSDTPLVDTARALDQALRSELNPSELGLQFRPVLSEALTAATGTTDFGGLFIGFSMFLIASAAMLVALLFRLSVERRASQIGLLLAVGFSPARVTRVLLTEGVVLAAVGSTVGVLVARGYAVLMLAGLRSWWASAVNTPFLKLHTSWTSSVIGFTAGVAIAALSVAYAIRGVSRMSPRALIAGAMASDGSLVTRKSKMARWIAGASATMILLFSVLIGAKTIGAAPAFFGIGVFMLIAALAMTRILLGHDPRSVICTPNNAMIRLGTRNARRHLGRSMLTISLIASATFIIFALQTFRIDVDASDNDRHSGTGGFTLYAESTTPLQFALNTTAGRESLSLATDTVTALGASSVFPFRLRPGDDSSCLNLYQPTKSKIIGAIPAMVERGGFTFSSTSAESDADRKNPWRLLDQPLPDGAIPVFGDEAAVLWQLHLGLGDDLMVTDEHGRQVALRFVGLLKGSALQDELIVSEEHFVELFPSIGGYGFFLIQAPLDESAALSAMLERDLNTFGFDAASTTKRLAAYLAVQNTYLSTFQSLGAFGLMLGVVGLAAVMLRNVWERRGELALMRAVGFRLSALGRLVLSENAFLVGWGLVVGIVAAMTAVAPHLMRQPGSFAWVSLAATLVGVFAVAMTAGFVALIPTLRAPLIPSLRSE